MTLLKVARGGVHAAGTAKVQGRSEAAPAAPKNIPLTGLRPSADLRSSAAQKPGGQAAFWRYSLRYLALFIAAAQ